MARGGGGGGGGATAPITGRVEELRELIKALDGNKAIVIGLNAVVHTLEGAVKEVEGRLHYLEEAGRAKDEQLVGLQTQRDELLRRVAEQQRLLETPGGSADQGPRVDPVAAALGVGGGTEEPSSKRKRPDAELEDEDGGNSSGEEEEDGVEWITVEEEEVAAYLPVPFLKFLRPMGNDIACEINGSDDRLAWDMDYGYSTDPVVHCLKEMMEAFPTLRTAVSMSSLATACKKIPRQRIIAFLAKQLEDGPKGPDMYCFYKTIACLLKTPAMRLRAKALKHHAKQRAMASMLSKVVVAEAEAEEEKRKEAKAAVARTLSRDSGGRFVPAPDKAKATPPEDSVEMAIFREAQERGYKFSAPVFFEKLSVGFPERIPDMTTFQAALRGPEVQAKYKADYQGCENNPKRGTILKIFEVAGVDPKVVKMERKRKRLAAADASAEQAAAALLTINAPVSSAPSPAAATTSADSGAAAGEGEGGGGGGGYGSDGGGKEPPPGPASPDAGPYGEPYGEVGVYG